MKTKREPRVVENPISSLLLCALVILFIGLRPISSIFVDMFNYVQGWGYVSWEGFDLKKENVLFDNFYVFLSDTGLPIESFFFGVAVIYFTCIYVTCRKLFPNHILLSFLVCLAAFSTFSYGTNGIKAGAAGALFLVALAYRDKMWMSILFLLLSWGFHHSMQLPVAAYILTLIFKNKKWYFFGWIFCLIMSIGHITFFQSLFADFSDERGSDYLMSSSSDMWGGKAGFRLDFVIYSAMPVLMGYFVKYKYELKDKLYDTMLNMYLATNGIWMLCMYAQFTNRIAYLSWFMYPIVLIYPCFTMNEKSHPLVVNRNKIIGYHLAFTLFMTFIYYA